MAKVSTDRERPEPAVTRLEALGLFFACVILLGVGVCFGIAMLPKADEPPAAAEDGPGNPDTTYGAEQPVLAWHAGRWYPAHVHSASAGRYFITYDDYSISWHEWVTARRLRQRDR